MKEFGFMLFGAALALSGCRQFGHVASPDEGEGATSVVDQLIQKNMSGPKTRKLGNCPSAVEGAETKEKDTSEGVELVITAPDQKGVEGIRARARWLASIKPTGTVKHSGKGTGGGKMGYCPIVLVSTRISVEDIDGGARVIVKALPPLDAGTLGAITRARVERLAESR